MALTVLDFGRTTFGASLHRRGEVLPGAGRRGTLPRACNSASRSAAFELVKEKLAYMNAGTFAMEAATYHDGRADRLGRTTTTCSKRPCSKCSPPTVLWRIINDTIQIFGGKAYFTDEPYERMMRDARINMIGEGANDVLRAFIALVGMRDVGLELQGILKAMKRPLRNLGKLSSFAGQRLESLVSAAGSAHPSGGIAAGCRPSRPAGGPIRVERRTAAAALSGRNRRSRIPIGARRRLLDRAVRQCVRVAAAGIAIEPLPTMATPRLRRDLIAGRYYLRTAERRIRANLAALWDNDDRETTEAADLLLS